MKIIKKDQIVNAIAEGFIDININVSSQVKKTLEEAVKNESSETAQYVIKQILDNHVVAKDNLMPMCQDTGIAVVFMEIGTDVKIEGGDIYDIINEGVRKGYEEGYLRKSVVKSPINRVNTKDNTPAIIHTKIVPGDKLFFKIGAKGGGSENMSLVKMLVPADGIEGIKKLVIDTIFYSGGKPCPPIILGLGIGGTFEAAAVMAKEALFDNYETPNTDPKLAKLEKEIMDEVNKTGVGPMGLGGDTTCIGVNIRELPCHIASLPVAINIQCHAHRHKEITL